MRGRSLAAVAGAVAASIAVAGASAAPRTFSDLQFDAGRAPDVFDVGAATSAEGTIVLSVGLGNRRAALEATDTIDLFFDADRDDATGNQDGHEYLLQLHGPTNTVGLYRWVDGDFDLVPSAAATAEWADAGVIRIAVPRGDLGGTASIEFALVTSRWAIVPDLFVEGNAHDRAPDGGDWRYDVVPGRLALVAGTIRARPATPRAGARFTADVAVTRADTGERVTSGTVTCGAVLARVSSRRFAGRFTAGRATCSLPIPRSARGRALRLTITVRHAGARVTRTLTRRVR